MSIEAGLNIGEFSKSSFSTKPLVWHAVLAAAVFIAIACRQRRSTLMASYSRNA
jgi:hypothetical protein